MHARRLYYSEALVEYPLTVLPSFADYLDVAEAKLVRDIWQLIATTMIEFMGLGAEQGLETRGIVIQQLDWFDTLLEDGRDYLIGDTLTRVDISVASLLAPLVSAPGHPTYANLQVPPRFALDLAEWQSRPISQFVARMYQRHR